MPFVSQILIILFYPGVDICNIFPEMKLYEIEEAAVKQDAMRARAELRYRLAHAKKPQSEDFTITGSRLERQASDNGSVPRLRRVFHTF